MGRRWPILLFALGCAVIAVIVAWWPGDESIVRVESSDADGICVRDLETGERECLAYTPEFPSEARYRVDECLRFIDVYRSNVPPHAERVTCPGAQDLRR